MIQVFSHGNSVGKEWGCIFIAGLSKVTAHVSNIFNPSLERTHNQLSTPGIFHSFCLRSKKESGTQHRWNLGTSQADFQRVRISSQQSFQTGSLLCWSHNVTLQTFLVWLLAFLMLLCIPLSLFTLVFWYSHKVIFHLKTEVHIFRSSECYHGLQCCDFLMQHVIKKGQNASSGRGLATAASIPFSRTTMMSYFRTCLLTDCPELWHYKTLICHKWLQIHK